MSGKCKCGIANVGDRENPRYTQTHLVATIGMVYAQQRPIWNGLAIRKMSLPIALINVINTMGSHCQTILISAIYHGL